MESIDLDITESNELTFKVQIDGSDGQPAKIRMVCEDSQCSYMFKAQPSRELDTFDFLIPSMQSKLQEGNYKSRIEVIVGNKHFIPVEFEINFKQPVKVVAESVTKKQDIEKHELKVTGGLPVLKKPVSLSVSESAVSPTLKERYGKKREQ